MEALGGGSVLWMCPTSTSHGFVQVEGKFNYNHKVWG